MAIKIGLVQKKIYNPAQFLGKYKYFGYCLSWKKRLVHSQLKGIGKTDRLNKRKNSINYSEKMADGWKRGAGMVEKFAWVKEFTIIDTTYSEFIDNIAQYGVTTYNYI